MKNIFIDIDNTICYMPEKAELDYNLAIPCENKINIVNKLYEKNNITMWTARGMKTGIDWYETTERQLKKWGVKYDELRCDKPPFDILIDDKAINDLNIIKLTSDI